MNNKKQLIIIGVLGALLLSSIGLSVFFYFKHEKTKKLNKQLVTIYIAKNNLNQWDKIKEDDIKETTIARKYILETPLLKKEIVGKYAKEKIFKNDTFRKEKLSNKLPEKIKEKVSPFKYNSYNMPFRMFSNPNYALKKDDYIKIISVFENKKPTGANDFIDPFKVQFVAKDIKVLGFILDGKEVDKSIVEKEVIKKVKKKEVKQKVEARSQELILDIKDQILLQLTDDYNKGKQLWMVKTAPPKGRVVKNSKSSGDKKGTNRFVKKDFPFVMYDLNKPKKLTETATINYTNENEKYTSSKKVPNKNFKQCVEKKNYIVGTSNRIYFREKPSVYSKINVIRDKNTIIPYDSKVNDNTWYKTCDNNYVRFSQVKEVSKAQVEQMLKNKSSKKTKKEVSKNSDLKTKITSESVNKIENSIKFPSECSKEFETLIVADIGNIRRGPASDYKIIAIKNKGDRVTFKKEYDGNWIETCDGNFIHQFEGKKVVKVTN